MYDRGRNTARERGEKVEVVHAGIVSSLKAGEEQQRTQLSSRELFSRGL